MLNDKPIMHDDFLIKTLDHKQISDVALDGTQGNNRRSGENLIKANNDLHAILIWLDLYDDSPQTYRSYIKEIERLYAWSIIAKQKPFSSLSISDMTEYRRFLAAPTPKELWCAPKRPRNHKHWKPFTKGLNKSSVALAFTIIGRCFTFLTDAGYLNGNPIRLMGKSGHQNVDKRASIERYLSQETWTFLWGFITDKTPKTTMEHLKYERTRFIFALLYLQVPRASEVVSHAMNSIYKDRGQWWWRMTGKGNKTRKVPCSDEMIEALGRYRQSRGLSTYPTPTSSEPLVASLTGEKFLCTDSIYKLVKQVVSDAAQVLKQQDEAAATKLVQASTHWFRHTGLTHLADNGVDLRFLKATARHESIETTQRYLHIEDDAWQQELNKKRL